MPKPFKLSINCGECRTCFTPHPSWNSDNPVASEMREGSVTNRDHKKRIQVQEFECKNARSGEASFKPAKGGRRNIVRLTDEQGNSFLIVAWTTTLVFEFWRSVFFGSLRDNVSGPNSVTYLNPKGQCRCFLFGQSPLPDNISVHVYVITFWFWTHERLKT